MREDIERRHEQERAPVEQAGGGESEGFEQAEEQLERNASHESDQLPEEAPSEVVEDDTPEAARDEAEDSPGAA